MFVLVFGDDILTKASSTKLAFELVENLNKAFALKDLGVVNYFLGIQVSCTASVGLHLSQDNFIKKLLRKAKTQFTKAATLL